ncbi:MAG: LEA type 2 family protein [Ferruginibacter sp.]
MKNIRLFIFLLLAYPAILSSCRSPKDLEFREFKNLSLENIGFSAAKLKVDVVYYNPNNFGLELNRTDLDIFVDSSFLGHSAQDVQVKVPRREQFSIPLVIDLDMKNLLKNGITALLNKEVNIKVVGRVKVGKAGVFKSFPLTYTTRQKLSFL